MQKKSDGGGGEPTGGGVWSHFTALLIGTASSYFGIEYYKCLTFGNATLANGTGRDQHLSVSPGVVQQRAVASHEANGRHLLAHCSEWIGRKRKPKAMCLRTVCFKIQKAAVSRATFSTPSFPKSCSACSWTFCRASRWVAAFPM